jgi:hypothetical protein
MIKKLNPTTIIPKELYVKRKADKQLKDTIDNMGRPASILVSRQMGKTNLLLNAKRDMENESTKFIYIDLSNSSFSDIRECFRYIIDTAIDIHLDTFEDIEDEILERREKNRLPQREHEHELRLLLKAFNGKIIIILDEIDSMKKYNFSDHFFSQIRSVYFASRENYPEFKNLTYILSGVLEPSEIIHDKTKSPFNISEKIYLNDFTLEEYNSFISRIDLDFLKNKEIVDKIYEWSNGHPRITWDIISNLEDTFIENGVVEIQDVDNIVNHIYIKHSDTPPIDNIKNLIAEDINLAQSILDIKQEIYLNISDAIKNKLYLFGIVEIYDNEELTLKNKILDENLSEEFLKNIIYSNKSSFEIAQQYFNEGKYDEAIVEYMRFVDEKDISEVEKYISYMNTGLCLYYLSDYKEAFKYMSEVTINKDKDPYNYYTNEANQCLCLLSMEKYEKCLEKCDLILKYNQPSHSMKAYLYQANVYSNYKIKKNKEKMTVSINNGLNEIHNFSPKGINEKNVVNTILVSFYYLQSSVFKRDNDFINMKISLEKILNLQLIEYEPMILIELISLDTKDKEVYIQKFFDTIKNNNIEINDFEQLKYSRNIIYQYVDILIEEDNVTLLKEFLNFCQNTYTEYFSSKCSVLLNTSEYFFFTEDKKDKALKISRYSLNFRENEKIFMSCYKDIYSLIVNYYYLVDYTDLKENYLIFLDFIIENSLYKHLNYTDYFLLSQSIHQFMEKKQITDATNAINKIDIILENMNNEFELFKTNFLDIKHKLARGEEERLRLSNECLLTIKKHEKNNELFPDDFKKNINYLGRFHTDYYIKNVKKETYVRAEAKVGNNDKCPCGSGKKYKKCCKNK